MEENTDSLGTPEERGTEEPGGGVVKVAVVTGGRNYQMYEQEWLWFLQTVKINEVKFVAVGDCRTGVDRKIAGGLIAFYEGAVFHAAWNLLGKKAGSIRNGRMADFAASQIERGVCIAFPGASGTNGCKLLCTQAGLQLLEWRRRDSAM